MASFKFFRWHCPQCGIAGGVQLDSETPEPEVLRAATISHDETQSCASTPLLDDSQKSHAEELQKYADIMQRLLDVIETAGITHAFQGKPYRDGIDAVRSMRGHDQR